MSDFIQIEQRPAAVPKKFGSTKIETVKEVKPDNFIFNEFNNNLAITNVQEKIVPRGKKATVVSEFSEPV